MGTWITSKRRPVRQVAARGRRKAAPSCNGVRSASSARAPLLFLIPRARRAARTKVFISPALSPAQAQQHAEAVHAAAEVLHGR